MRRLSYLKRVEIVFMRSRIKRQRILSRFNNGGLDMNGKSVFSDLKSALKPYLVRDEHILGASDKITVKVYIRNGIKSLKNE